MNPINVKQNEATTEPMDDLLDRHLRGPADELAPSSGFVLSVMESVQAQANETSPIAFPWRRVVPGMIAILCGLVALIAFALRSVSRGAVPGATHSVVHFAVPLRPPFTPGEMALGWVLLGICLSLAAIGASFRLAGGDR